MLRTREGRKSSSQHLHENHKPKSTYFPPELIRYTVAVATELLNDAATLGDQAALELLEVIRKRKRLAG